MSESEIQFVKLSGSGNDHICIDNRDRRYDALLADGDAVGRFARALCRRSLGVGADGVIFACKPEIENVADVGARFFEADGSEAALCGNGVACFTRWAFDEQFVSDSMIRILTPAGVVKAERAEGGYIVVCIPAPQDIHRNLCLCVGGFALSCDYVVTGVPHLATYVEDVNDLDMARLGPAIRHHKRFAPEGVNANFVQVLGEGEIAVRTWEFGVEGETLACGTGSASAAILAALRNDWPAEYRRHEKPVIVHARSGDVLRVYFTQNDDGTVTDVCLETVVRFLFAGTLAVDLAQEAVTPGMGVSPMRPVGVPPADDQDRGMGVSPMRPVGVSPADASVIDKRKGSYLPHWTKEGATYAIAFRLADSLPAHVVEGWRKERGDIVDRARSQGRPLSTHERKELHRLYSARVESYLDAGQGACYLRNPEVAQMVQGALHHLDGDRYELIAWAVMPNHVHVVVRPLAGQDLDSILHSWKSFTAKEANRILGRQGQLWQEEYYDHLIRDEEDLVGNVSYILANPAKAGLRDWRWVGVHRQGQDAPATHGRDAHATKDGTNLQGQDAPATHGRDAHATEGGTTGQGQDAPATHGRDAHATNGNAQHRSKQS